MIQNKVDLSVIIPFYNSGKYIQEAIDSVNQYQGSYSVEIIIINDGSTDDFSLRKLEQLKLSCSCKIINQSNQGPAAARNKGIDNATGEFLLFLDSDNYIDKNYIPLGIEELKTNQQLGVVYAERHYFGQTDLREFPKSAPFDILKIIQGNYIDMCTVVRRKAMQDVGGFTNDSGLKTCEDWELWIKLYRQGWEFSYLNQKLFYYRIRENSISAHQTQSLQDATRYIQRKHIDLYHECYAQLEYRLSFLEKTRNREMKNPFRTFLKFTWLKFKK